MRLSSLPLVLFLLTLFGCDWVSSGSADQGAALAAALPGLAAETSGNPQDTIPMVVRRVWYTNSSDIWSGPSADGRYLSVTLWGEDGNGALGIHDLGTGENRRITPEPNPWPQEFAWHSAITREGERIAYTWWSDDNGWELRLIDVDGSGSRVLYHDPSVEMTPRQWSEDGESILVSGVDNRDNLIGLVSVRDGSLQVLKRLGQRDPVAVVMSPDGRYLVYDDRAHDNPQRDVFLLTLATGEERTLVEHPAEDLVLGWAPDGKHVLFASDRTGTMGAWLLPVTDGRPSGSPSLVKPDLWRAEPLGFDANGSFYYVVWMHMREVLLATLDLETGQLLDRPTRVSSSYLGSNNSPEWSPDGRQLAYLSERNPWREFGSEVIVIRSAETGEEKVLQPSLGSYMHPRWSPDGQSLLVRARDELGRGFFSVDVQTGEVEPLIRFPAGSANIASRAEWIEDGKALLYWWPPASLWPPPASVAQNYIPESDRERSTLRIRNLDTGEEEVIYKSEVPKGDLSSRFAVSPDRRKVAFADSRNGRGSLLVMPVGGGDSDEVLSDAGESLDLKNLPSEIQWSPDGRYLYYVSRGLWRVSVDGGEPVKLDWFDDVQARPFFRFQPGGSRVALMCVEGEGGGEVWVMENFVPGLEEVESERRMP